MHLVIGGAYQGKREYALEHFRLAPEDIYTCADNIEPDWRFVCLEHLERYVLYCMDNGLTPRIAFSEDAVLIADDISCGIVPMNPRIRLWREEVGRYLSELSRSAETVTRLFCGLPQKLK